MSAKVQQIILSIRNNETYKAEVTKEEYQELYNFCYKNGINIDERYERYIFTSRGNVSKHVFSSLIGKEYFDRLCVINDIK